MRIISYDAKPGIDVAYIPTTEEKVSQNNDWRRARVALNSLPSIERKVVELRLEGRSWVYIADKLSITLYMAKKYNTSGMQKLKKTLTRY